MLLLVLSILSASKISAFLKNELAAKARQNARLSILSIKEEPLKPGYHKGNGISFTLTHKIYSTKVHGINGFSRLDSTLAVVSPLLFGNKNKLDEEEDSFLENGKTVFVDIETQTLHKIVEKLDEDGDDVTFYKTVEMNPLAVFTNLVLQTENGVSENSNCNFKETVLSGSKCEKDFTFNWDKVEDKPKLRKMVFNPPYSGLNMSFRAGAKGNAMGSAKVAFSGLSNVDINYGFDFELFVGVGIKANELQTIKSVSIWSESIPIFGISTKIAGYNISFGLNVVADFSLKNITIKMPKPVEIYRQYAASLRQNGKISTTTGFKIDPIEHNFQPSSYFSLQPDEIFDFIKQIQYGVEPAFTFGLKLGLTIGKYINSNVGVQASLSSKWNFIVDSEKCVFPYLYGDTYTSLVVSAYAQPLTIDSYVILPRWDYSIPVFAIPTARSCIFEPGRAKEGNAKLINTEMMPTYVYTVKNAYTDSILIIPGIFGSYIPTLEANSGNTHLNSLSLPKITFTNDRKEYNIGKSMVLTNPPNNTNFKWKINENNGWWSNQYYLEDSFDYDDSSSTICLKKALTNYICLKHETTVAARVEVFKEFKGNNRISHILFKSIVPKNSVLGLITHGVFDEVYSAPLLGYKVTDDSTSKTSEGIFYARDELRINVQKIKNTINGNNNVTITISSCKASNACEEIGYFITNNAKYNQELSSADLGIKNELVFNLGDSASMKVRVEVNFQDSSKNYGNEKIFQEETFSTGEEIKIELNDKVQVTLIGKRSAPSVIFALITPLSTTEMAIISRVFQTNHIYNGDPITINFQMQENEQYGILRFLTPKYSNFEKFEYVAIIEAMNITLLSEMDGEYKDAIMTLLRPKKTLFDGSINIPFRRNDNGKRDIKVTLRYLFATQNNGKCSNGVSIDGASVESTGILFGCYDKVNKDSNNNFTAISSEANINELIENIILGKDGDWKLQLYNLTTSKYGSYTGKIVKNLIEFPSQSTSTYIAKEVIQYFVKKLHKKLSIKCSQCDSINLVEPDGKVVQTITDKKDNIFSFSVDRSTDLMVVANCNSSSKAYCQFEEDFSKDGLSLVQFPSADGVTDTSEEVIRSRSSVSLTMEEPQSRLLPGVSRQIVFGKGVSQASKTWNGAIQRMKTNIKPDLLQIVVSKEPKGKLKLSAKLGNLDIPFSAQHYYDDPYAFFEMLGIISDAEGKYRGDFVNFLSNGKILVSENHFDRIKINDLDASKMIGVPQNYVTSFQIVNKKTSPGTVAGIIFGVIFAIAAVAGLVIGGIYFMKRKASQDDKEGFTEIKLSV